MNVQEFQNKLKEIQEIAKQNKNTLKAADIRDVFDGCDLDKNQLTGVLKYLTSQGIMIEVRDGSYPGVLFVTKFVTDDFHPFFGISFLSIKKHRNP